MSQPANARPSKLKMAMLALVALIAVLGVIYVVCGFLGSAKLDRMRAIAKARVEEMKKLDPARPVLWGEPTPGNAWDDYAKAVAEVKKFPDARKLLQVVQRSADADPAVGKAAIAAHGNEVLGHLRRGASRSTSKYPYEWEKGMSMPLPALSDMNATASLAILKARTLVEERKSRDAAVILLDVCQFGRDLGADGVLISEMVGTAILNLALTEMRDVLTASRFDWPAHEDLAKSLGILESILPRHDRALLNDAMLLAGIADDTLDAGWGPQRMLLADAMERTSEWMKRAGQADTLPWPESQKELQTIESEASRTWNPISQISVPSLQKMSRTHRERKAQIRMARIAAQFLRTGEVIEQDDPFGGKLKTKRAGDNLKIWSIGADNFDNLGVGDWKGESNDIVLDVTRK
jgi:hypothetical protein